MPVETGPRDRERHPCGGWAWILPANAIWRDVQAGEDGLCIRPQKLDTMLRRDPMYNGVQEGMR
jgi:hypothetical protein